MFKYTTCILLISLFWTKFSFGQKPLTDDIKNKVALINSWKAALDTLSPFQGEDDIIDSLNNRVEDYLLQVLNDKNVVKYRVDSMLTISSIKSPDKKIIIFSYYENTGGSYQSNINIVYYKLPNGQPKAERLSICKDNVEHSEEAYGGTFNKIVLLKANKKTKYLALGGGIGCNTCEFNYSVLLEITKESLQTDFCLLLDYRQNDGSVTYNPKTKTISYEYTVDMTDSIYGTDCSDGQKISGNNCRYRGKYRFNGDTFVQVKNK